MENFVLFYPVNKKADVDELLSFVLDFSAIFLHQLDDKATHLICILICVRQGHLELRVCPMRPYQTKEMALVISSTTYLTINLQSLAMLDNSELTRIFYSYHKSAFYNSISLVMLILHTAFQQTA